MSRNFSDIVIGSPVGRGATSVSAKSGSSHERPDNQPNLRQYHAPPFYQIRGPKGCPDLTGSWVGGKANGVLKVIGWLRKGDRGQMWLVRCVCGIYEERSSKAVQNPDLALDKCADCKHLDKLKRLGSNKTRQQEEKLRYLKSLPPRPGTDDVQVPLTTKDGPCSSKVSLSECPSKEVLPLVTKSTLPIIVFTEDKE